MRIDVQIAFKSDPNIHCVVGLVPVVQYVAPTDLMIRRLNDLSAILCILRES